jgi:hypothetical protein
MPDQRLVDLASRLLELTRAGKVRWTPEAKPDEAPDEWQAASFSTVVADATVTVTSDSPDGRYPYRLRATGVGGAQVARLETGQDAEQWLGDREADPWESTLRDLYAAAREASVHADATLEAILEELQNR